MSVADFIGALGLFLLGMWLMTEGLKLAGGQALKHMLGQWTSSRVRGLSAGILVTALVQSSSAVTVAAIGFVNARLMTFSRSLWVIFGSNVGTTLTAWIITIFGLKLDIHAATYGMIGVGAFLRVFAPYERGKALGMAVAGFGLLFLGIDALQSSFVGIAESGIFLQLLGTGSHRLFWGLGVGLVLTVFTQSSSAAVALILTALATSTVTLDIAAAAVIGANVGTTSTALISAIGATANAKRLAMAHVLFNLLAGLVAFLLMPAFLWMVLEIAERDGWGADPPIQLAIFHSLFNIFGVFLMWPIEPKLSRFLLKRFVKPAEGKQSEFLDRNVASIPDLALRALSAQLHQLTREIASQRLESFIHQPAASLWVDLKEGMMEEVGDYIENVSRAKLSEKLSQQLAAGLAIKHYLNNSCQSIGQMAQLSRSELRPDSWASRHLDAWLATASDFALAQLSMDRDLAQAQWRQCLDGYRELKNSLLAAVPMGRASIQEVDTALQVASLGKRHIEQLLHTHNRFATLDETSPSPGMSEEKGADAVNTEDRPGEPHMEGEVLEP